MLGIFVGSGSSSAFLPDISPVNMFCFSSSCRQLFLLLAIFKFFDSQFLFSTDFGQIKDKLNIFST